MKETLHYMVSMFEEKAGGRRRLSTTRLLVAAFTFAFVFRLIKNLEPLSWGDVFLAFCVLFALPISKAMNTADPKAVLDMVTSMFPGRQLEKDPAIRGPNAPDQDERV